VCAKTRNNYMPRLVFYRKMRLLFQKNGILNKKRKSTALVPRTGVGQGILPSSLDPNMVALIAVLRRRGIARCVGASTLMKRLSISFFSRMRARLSLYDIVTTFSAKREPQMQAGQGATQH
jgi:hypothetical protein